MKMATDLNKKSELEHILETVKIANKEIAELETKAANKKTYSAGELDMLHSRAEVFFNGESKTYSVQESHNKIRQHRMY